MPYSESLTERVREIFQRKKVLVDEKRMMGGLTFMVNDKMCVGILGEELMARVGPDQYELALSRKGCREMDFTGRPMKGFVFIGTEGIDLDEDLEQWIDMSLVFNKSARSSVKKKK